MQPKSSVKARQAAIQPYGSARHAGSQVIQCVKEYWYDKGFLVLTEQQYEVLDNAILKYDADPYEDFGKNETNLSSQQKSAMTKIAEGLGMILDWVQKYFSGKKGENILSYWSTNSVKGSFWYWIEKAKEGKECNNEIAKKLRAILHSGEVMEVE